MRNAVLPALLLVPAVARGAETAGGTGISLAGAFIQMFAALALIVGCIFLAKYLVSRISGGFSGSAARPGHIRIIETRYLSPKKSLILIEVGGEYLLLSSSGDNLGLVKQIDMLEEIEVVEDLGGPARGQDFQEKLAALLRRREK